LKPRERQRRVPGADNLLDDLQRANDIFRPVWFAEAGVAVGLGKCDLGTGAGRVQDARTVAAAQPGGDCRPQAPLGQTQIQHREIRLVTLSQFRRVVNGAGNAANLITMRDKNVLQHVGQ
jgi:hypothetical protein